MVLLAGPGTVFSVAGSKGTAVFTEPRVATVAHDVTVLLVVTTYCPVAGRDELVPADPRAMVPLARTTAVLTFAAVGQITARCNGMPELRPPPWFLVSM